MEFSSKHFVLFLTLLTIALTHYTSSAQTEQSTEALDLWPNTLSLNNNDEQLVEQIDDEFSSSSNNRRSLLWGRAFHYYISYGALSANRVPCPPRSGRSYYTHNCYRARGPVHPYTRGCSAITRCRRSGGVSVMMIML